MIIVEDSSLLTVPKQRLIPHHAGPHREAPGPVRRQKEGEKQGVRTFIAVSWENQERQGKQV